jgi:hypothetical protein
VKSKAKRKRKNPAAVSLGRRSWKGLSAEERSERARAARETQLSLYTPSERSEMMRDLVSRRWKKAAGDA